MQAPNTAQENCCGSVGAAAVFMRVIERRIVTTWWQCGPMVRLQWVTNMRYITLGGGNTSKPSLLVYGQVTHCLGLLVPPIKPGLKVQKGSS